MARIRVRTHGVRNALDEVAELPEETRDGAEAALKSWGRDIRATARTLVSKRSGRLRRRITVRINRKDLSAQVGVWADDAFYAYFQEHGTSHHAAQPFLLPAFEANRPDVVKDAGKEIRRRVT